MELLDLNAKKQDSVAVAEVDDDIRALIGGDLKEVAHAVDTVIPESLIRKELSDFSGM